MSSKIRFVSFNIYAYLTVLFGLILILTPAVFNTDRSTWVQLIDLIIFGLFWGVIFGVIASLAGLINYAFYLLNKRVFPNSFSKQKVFTLLYGTVTFALLNFVPFIFYTVMFGFAGSVLFFAALLFLSLITCFMIMKLIERTIK